MTAPTDRFWRNVMVVLSGTAAAQAIPLLGSLFIARLYVPAEFGMFASWIGLVSLAAVMLTGRYEMALVLEPTIGGRMVGVTAIVVIVLFSALVLCTLTIAATMALPTMFADVSLGLILAFVPVSAAMALAQTWQSWAAAEGRFGDLARMRIAQACGVTGLQVVAGAFSATSAVLAITQGVGLLLGLAAAFHMLPLNRNFNWVDVRGYCWRHRAFPIWSLPGGAVNTAASQLPMIVVAARFGTEMAGYLALSLRTLGAPVGLLGAAVLDVFKRRAALAYGEFGQCREDYVRTFKVLSLGSIVAMVVLGVFSERIFALAFGEPWRYAGVIAKWLLPLFALRFVASPLSYMFYIAGRQKLDLVWQVTLLAMTVLTLWAPQQFATTIMLYSGGYGVMYLVYLWISYRLSLGNLR